MPNTIYALNQNDSDLGLVTELPDGTRTNNKTHLDTSKESMICMTMTVSESPSFMDTTESQDSLNYTYTVDEMYDEDDGYSNSCDKYFELLPDNKTATSSFHTESVYKYPKNLDTCKGKDRALNLKQRSTSTRNTLCETFSDNTSYSMEDITTNYSPNHNINQGNESDGIGEVNESFYGLKIYPSMPVVSQLSGSSTFDSEGVTSKTTMTGYQNDYFVATENAMHHIEQAHLKRHDTKKSSVLQKFLDTFSCGDGGSCM